MNEVKKNWKKAWDDYEPTEYDKIYRSARHPKRNSHRPPSFLIVILVIIVGVGGAYMWELLNSKLLGQQVNNPFDRVLDGMIVSNRNGAAMDSSVDTIYDIFDDVSDHMDTIKKEKIATYKETIKNLDLSVEYDELKEQCINKLVKAEEYVDICQKQKEEKSSKERYKMQKEADKLLDEYEAIEVEACLSKAFDKADVKHTLEESGKIEYRYFDE